MRYWNLVLMSCFIHSFQAGESKGNQGQMIGKNQDEIKKIKQLKYPSSGKLKFQ